LFEDEIRTPSAIPREHALLPGSKTGNLIAGEVRTEAEGDCFIVRFYLVMPVPDDYRFKVCVVKHDVVLYPVYVRQDLSGPTGRSDPELGVADACSVQAGTRSRFYGVGPGTDFLR
jgi:hypothetical protein